MSANCEECVYYDYDEELAERTWTRTKWSGFSVAAHGTVPSTGPATITARPDGSEHDEP